MKKAKLLKNQKGFLTLDLILAFSLIFSAMLITVALSATLVAVEVAQYVAFSTSRAMYGANESQAAQISKAQAKYDELMAVSKLGGFLKSTWFAPKFEQPGRRDDLFGGIPAGTTHNPLWGTLLKIEAKILSFKTPFFGTTSNRGGLELEVNSLLGREVSDQECRAFQAQRWEKIKQKHDNSGITPGGFQPPIIMDNGC